MDPMTEVREALGAIETKTTATVAALDDMTERLDKLEEKSHKIEVLATQPNVGGSPLEGTSEQREHLKAFERHLRRPKDMGLRAELAQIEHKAASGLSDSAGGAVVPELLLGNIFTQAKNLTAMRRLATVASVSSGDVKFPINKNDAASSWVGETATRNATAEPTLIERKPTIGTVYSYVQCSEELAYDAAFDITGWFTNAIADEIGLAEGIAFISGNGTNKPTGILNTAPVADLDASPAPSDAALLYLPTGVADGFPADRLGSPAGDPMGVLADAIYALKAQYRADANWLMNSATAKVVAKWKDADGRPLWQPALVAGMPPTLMGYPVEIDEAMPDIGTNTHPMLFGDFRRGYLIADAGPLRITVDDNITQPGRIKWYIRKRVGGIVADQRAVVAVKCATS